MSIANPLVAEPALGERVALVGNGLGERMLYYPHLETELQLRYPDQMLTLRNLCYPGDTAGFRPRAGNPDPWAFPGAEALRPEFAVHLGEGHYPLPDEWLKTVKADTVLAFFGYNESFDGPEGLEAFRAELDAFVAHTQKQRYNGRRPPRLILISPVAFEDLSDRYDLPNGVEENRRLAAYARVVEQVAREWKIEYIDLFTPTRAAYRANDEPLTINGFSLTSEGYRLVARIISDAVYGQSPRRSQADYATVYDAIAEKDWYWMNDYRILNGVHVYGRRFEPFGNVNYPEEIQKIRAMTRLRDEYIHAVSQGDGYIVNDKKTPELSEVESNFHQPIEFLDVEEALNRFELPEGFEIDLFASEMEFPDLKNPVQFTFDNKGRLWVAVAPSYPHYRPGDERPNDKLLIFEDTDSDGRADRQTVFADGLHLPIGFTLSPEGVYLAQQPNLVLLADDDGDDRADRMEYLLHGFDSHDTHHSISAFSADPSGAFFMCEGRFLHSQVETPYGPQRCTDGGVWRFDPRSWRLERYAQADFSNPWGVALDEWGQVFISDASEGDNWWASPLSAKAPHGYEIEQLNQFTTHTVRPTSGTEFIFSDHFPEKFQGDFLINNTIGFLGAKQHEVHDDGAGFTGSLRQDLVRSSDPNFRPCDLEFAPDGSLYILDWHNPLIGHMQHSARDPKRDHDHGRIYRLTYPSRPLTVPAEIASATVPELLKILQSGDLRTRERARRELRSRPKDTVLKELGQWSNTLDPDDPEYDRYLVEGLWVSWGQGQVDPELLERCLGSDNLNCRAAAARVLRHEFRNVPHSASLLNRLANDPEARVRIEAIVAASWMDNDAGARVILESLKNPVTEYLLPDVKAALLTLEDDIDSLKEQGRLNLADNPQARAFLSGKAEYLNQEQPVEPIPSGLSKDEEAVWLAGREIYRRDGHCATCHGLDGAGAVEGVYPPLVGSEWVRGDEERLIKVVLKGLWGPIEVNGVHFDPSGGVPPMTGFESLLSDEEIAATLSYVRKAWGNDFESVEAESVRQARQEAEGKSGYYTVEELLREHPFESR